jgi:hypothetical protein
MKALLTFSLIAVLAALAACSGGGESQQAQGEVADQQAQSQAKTTIDEAEEAVAKTEAKQLEEGSEVTVVGTLGCGHCTYHVGDSCSAAIQTAEGAVYILDVAEESDWFKDRYSGTQLEVTGKIHHRGSEVMLESASITEL